MKKKLIIIFIIFSMFFPNLLFPQDKASLEIGLNVVSNYVWRGHDFFRNYAIQNQKSYGSHTGTWAFQPSITWNTPVNGLYVNLFSSFALQGRDDKDIDKRIQLGPGEEFIQNKVSLLDYFFDSSNDLRADYFLTINDIEQKAIEKNGSVSVLDFQKYPNFYKEEVGLRRNDELDLTIGYESETNIGIIGFGILHYSYANHLSVAKEYGTEVFLTYALPFLKPLKFSLYEDIINHTIYYNISYNGEYNLTRDITSNYNLGVGYYVFDNLQGISDVTLNYTISHSSGINIGLNITYRPDLKIHDYYFDEGDPITQEVLNTRLPVELNGQSSIYDGKVADPSRTLGPVNDFYNEEISTNLTNAIGIPNFSYKYIPRQTLPRYLWWISIGYSISIE